MPDFGSFAEWVSAIAACLAVYYAYTGIKEASKGAAEAIKQSNKTAQEAIKSKRLDYFSEYSKRYNDLVIKLPTDFNKIGRIFNDDDFRFTEIYGGALSERIRVDVSEQAKVIKSLFNLFSDEHYLYFEAKMVDKIVWRNWNDGIEMCLSYPAFKFVWSKIRESSIYGDDYRKFIDEIITKQKKV